MTGLQIRLLGAPVVELNGQGVLFPRHKALALCAYLAVEGEPQRRDTLATLFWPECNQSHARANLRRVLATITRILGREYLLVDRETIGIDLAADLWIDVHYFQAAMAHVDQERGLAGDDSSSLLKLSDALALYRGDLLSGFSLRDTPEFDMWHYQSSEQLHFAASQGFELLAHEYEKRHDLAAATAVAQDWLALDPLNEAAHSQLIRLHALAGNRDRALRQYLMCVRLLAQELDVSPAHETEALYGAVKTGSLGPTPQPVEKVHLSLGIASEEIRSLSVVSLGLVADANNDDDYGAIAVGIWDPEPFFAMLRPILQELDATVEHLGADGGLFYFGLPVSHEDDAERALRAAFELDKLAVEHGLQAAIGIETGLAYVRRQADAGRATGAVVSQATRLQRAARPGQILVGRTTYRRTRDAYALEPTQGLGDDQPVYRALHPLPQSHKTHGILGLRAELIGRDEELSGLKSLYSRSCAAQGQVVFLVGEAGLGKSRLVAELKESIEPEESASRTHLWLEGRCLEMSISAGYWPIREMLRNLFGWRFDGRTLRFGAHVTTYLHEMMENGYLSADDVEELAPILAILLAFEYGNAWDHRLDSINAAQLRHRTIMALTAFMVGLAQRQPMVLVVEDLHWSDELTIDLLVNLMSVVAGNRILLLCVARPASRHRVGQLPAIAARKCPGHYRELRLRELTPGQSRQLVESLLKEEALSSQVKDRILNRAEGNPFFAEEVVRTLIDTGEIAYENGLWYSAARADDGPLLMETVSHNVHSVILSRMDRLKPSLCRILQIASVLGRTFPSVDLVGVLGDEGELEQALSELQLRGFLLQERVVPVPEYSFHHVLTQQAIYGTLLPELRIRLHREAAIMLEDRYAGDVGDHVERLAYHWVRTPDHGKASEYLLLAADKARSAYLNRDAASYYRQALQRQKDRAADEPDVNLRPIEIRAWYMLGRVYYAEGNMPASEEAIRQAISLGIREGLEPHTLARYHFWLCEALFWGDGPRQSVIDTANEGLALLEKDEKSAESVMLAGHLALCSQELNDHQTFQEKTSWYGQFIRDIPFCEELSPAYHHLFCAAQDEKDLAYADAICSALAQKADDIGDLVTLAKAYFLRGHLLHLSGDYVTACATLLDALELSRKSGETINQAFNLNLLAYQYLLMADFTQALGCALQIKGGDYWLEADTYPRRFMKTMGGVSLGVNRPKQAIRYLTRFLEEGEDVLGDSIVWLGHALLAVDRRGEAEEHFRAGARKLLSIFTWPTVDHPERKSTFVATLAGLDAALDDAHRFQADCAALRAHDMAENRLFQQWHLEPATRHEFGRAEEIPFSNLIPAGWTWRDPSGDCSYRFDDGLVVDAADGRDLWHVNEAAPRLVMQVEGDFCLETTCSPADPLRPTMGGLLIWRDLRNFVRLDRGACGGQEISFMGSFEGEDACFGRGRLPANRVTLRLECVDHHVRALCSADGERWYTVGQITLSTDLPLEAGLLAIGYVDRMLYPGSPAGGGAIRFESFSITRS